MYVAGPGVPKGETRAHPTNHLDITATIAAIAGAAQYSPHPIDGQSFAQAPHRTPQHGRTVRARAPRNSLSPAQALTSAPPALSEWRDFSFSEFYVNQNTWRAIRKLDPASGKPHWALH